MILKSKNRKSKTVTVSLFCLIAMIFIGIAAYYYFDSKSQDTENTVNYDSATEEQRQSGMDAKKEFVEEQYSEEGSESTSENNIPASKVDIVLSSTNVSSGTLQIRTMIQSSAVGLSCNLKLLKPGEEDYTEKAIVQAVGGYSTCQGFDIPTSSLTSGTWSISISLDKDSETVGNVSGEVNL